MMPYIIMFALSLFLLSVSFKIKKNKLASLVVRALALFLPCIMAAIRSYDIGIDTKVYQIPIFEESKAYPTLWQYLAISSNAGLLYRAISWICSKFLTIEALFFIIEAMIIIPLYISFCTLKFTPSKKIIAMTLFYFIWYNMTLNMARQSIAISFCIMSFALLTAKRYKSSIASFICAILFHISALVFVLYILYYLSEKILKDKTLKRLIFIAVVFVSTIIAFNFTVFMNFLNTIDESSTIQRYAVYGENFSSGGFMIRRFIYWAAMIALAYISPSKNKSDGNGLTVRRMALVSLLGFVTNTFILYSYRVFMYFGFPFFYNELPNVAFRFNNKKNRALVIMVIVILSFIYWFNKYVIEKSSGTIPYEIASGVMA